MHMHPRLHCYEPELGRYMRRKFYSLGMGVIYWDLFVSKTEKSVKCLFFQLINQVPMESYTLTNFQGHCDTLPMSVISRTISHGWQRCANLGSSGVVCYCYFVVFQQLLCNMHSHKMIHVHRLRLTQSRKIRF